MQLITKFSKAAGIAAMMALMPITAWAQEKTHNHTLGSAPDVWRIELRDLERFLAMSSGDRDGVDELRSITIRLGAGDQYHDVKEVSPFLSINGGSRVMDFLEVRRGQRVHLERLDESIRNTYDLWLHANQRTRTDTALPTLHFNITVNARELDCAGRRICRRGDNGIIVYRATLPVPTVRSNRCIPENTYRVTAVNGATMVLRPNSRGRAVIAIPPENHDDGPHLAMQSGEICIASTSR